MVINRDLWDTPGLLIVPQIFLLKLWLEILFKIVNQTSKSHLQHFEAAFLNCFGFNYHSYLIFLSNSLSHFHHQFCFKESRKSFLVLTFFFNKCSGGTEAAPSHSQPFANNRFNKPLNSRTWLLYSVRTQTKLLYRDGGKGSIILCYEKEGNYQFNPNVARGHIIVPVLFSDSNFSQKKRVWGSQISWLFQIR